MSEQVNAVFLLLLDSFENVFIVFVVPQEIAKAKEITAMLQTDR